jgi:hypothetical protein
MRDILFIQSTEFILAYCYTITEPFNEMDAAVLRVSVIAGLVEATEVSTL